MGHKGVVADTTISLPVFEPGALLSFGDSYTV